MALTRGRTYIIVMLGGSTSNNCGILSVNFTIIIYVRQFSVSAENLTLHLKLESVILLNIPSIRYLFYSRLSMTFLLGLQTS